MSLIEKEIQINSNTIKNRVFKPAMSEQLADRNGNPKHELLSSLYEEWAKGGAGLLISGNIMVDRSALGEPSNIVLDDKSDLSSFRKWIAPVKKYGALFYAQINHPGKQIPNFLSKAPLAPSAIPLEGPLANNFNTPVEMTQDDILKTISDFALSAKLCKEVGFDGIEIHAAHGYLINQFLSPKHNQRKDEWRDGKKFLISVYEEIRKSVGDDYPIIIKLNSSDFEDGGYSEEDAVSVMKLLEEAGINGIEVSGGTYESSAMTGEGQEEGGYFLNFARKARKSLTIPLLLTGGFKKLSKVEEALSDGIDMVGIGRSMILYPNLVNEMLNGSQKIYQNRVNLGKWEKLGKIFMLSWFELQMVRIARKKQPNPNLHIFFGVLFGVKHIGLKAFKPRRNK